MESKKNDGLLSENALPDTWRIEPLKHHMSMSKGLPVQKTDLVDDGVAIISYGQIHSKNNTTVDLKDEFVRYVPRSLAPIYSSSRLKYGDVIFADTSEDVDGIGNAILNTRPSEIYAGYHTVACRPNPKTLDGKFFAYLTKTDYWRSQLRKLAMGVKVFSVTQNILSRSYVLLPPLKEQQRIAQMLDELISPLDSEELLLTQQIDILERYKKSLIHEAVTKGLDPDIPMKPSGIEWIGDVPAYWTVERISYHAKLESGHTPSTQHPEWWKEEECIIPWLTTSDIHRFRDGKLTTIFDTEEHVSKAGLNHSSARILPAGTVGLSRTASVGFSIIMGTDMASSQDFADWIPDESLYSKYLLYAFRAMTELFDQLKLGSTHKTIYMHVLKTLKMPIPPLDEQQKIAAYLDEHCTKIDAILEIKRQQVEILKKRRQSLIYEYVTGKRRVGEVT